MNFFEALVDLDIDEDDNSIHSSLDFELLEKFVGNNNEDDDDPEIS